MIEWVFLALGILLIIGTGIFVASEFSLVALDQATVQQAVDKNETGAISVLASLKSLSTQLSSAQLGITLTTLLTGYVFEPSLGRLLHAPLKTLGLPSVVAEPIAGTVAMVIVTLISLLLGELVPKNIAISLPMATAKKVVPLQLGFTKIFRFMILLLNGFANKFLYLFGLEVQEELSGARSPAELSSLVRRSAQLGTLDQGTANFVTRTLDFSAHTAADVMTPRIRLETVEATDSAEDVVKLARRTGYSRFPVVGDSKDDILGVVHIKRAIAVPHDRRSSVHVPGLMSEVLRVPETIRLDNLLIQLRDQGLQLAVVLDEYGGTAGVTTREDLVEEIIGEVADEHDRAHVGVRKLASGHWIFSGLMRPDEMNQIDGLTVPDEARYETVGGFVMATLGRIAKIGDEVNVPSGVLRVERMDGRRVDRLRFVPMTPVSTEGKSSEEKVEP